MLARGAGGAHKHDDDARVAGFLNAVAAAVGGIKLDVGRVPVQIILGPNLSDGIQRTGKQAFGHTPGLLVKPRRGRCFAFSDVLRLLHDVGHLADAIERFVGIFHVQAHIGGVPVLEPCHDTQASDEGKERAKPSQPAARNHQPDAGLIEMRDALQNTNEPQPGTDESEPLTE